MATPKIIPRAAGGGSLGADAWGWGGAYVTNITTSSATEGGKLVLAADDGAVMADNHRLGVIEFKGAEDTSNTLSIGARIQAIARDAWDGSNNDADLQFYTTDGTTESMALKLDADNLATFMGAVSIDNVAISAIQSSAEAFADNDTSLMTSASIQDKILAYGYTTATGDMTGVSITGGTNLTTASETNTTSGDYSVTLNVDDAFLVNDANDTTTGTITAAGFTTTGTWTFDTDTATVGITAVQTGSTFSDVDTELMSAGAIKEKIEAYGYSTATGDITGVTAGTGMSGGGTSGTVTLTNAGVTSNVAGTGIGVSGATGAVTITNSGVTSNVAGSLIDVDSATGAVTIAVDLSELTDGTADVVGSADELVYLDAGSQKRKQIDEIKLGQFNNDQSWADDQTGAEIATALNADLGGDVSFGNQASDSVTFAGPVVVTGNLTVNGTTTTIATANMQVEDQFVTLNDGGSAADAGIIVEGQGTALGWDESESRWGIDFTGAAEDDTTITPDAYVSCVVTADDANYSKNGNIKINGGDIYIYVE